MVRCWTLKKNSFQKTLDSYVFSRVYVRPFCIYSFWYPEFARVVLNATWSLKVYSPLSYWYLGFWVKVLG